MTRPCNRKKIEREFIDDPEGKGPMTTFLLGLAGGSQRLYANIDRIKPGGKSCKLHSHSRQEEFFYILKGRCTLRVGIEKHRLSAGDFFCKPAGLDIAHQFVNESDKVVEILDVGLHDPDDEIYYPEENVRVDRKHKKIYQGDSEIRDWSSDPNA